MMNKIITILMVSLVAATTCYAQKDSIALNEQNEYTYFKVGHALPNVNAQALATHLKQNIAGVQSAGPLKEGNGVTARGGMLVYKKGLVTGQEEGRIDYNLSVDFKESKYRLIMTNFTFVPYQRNRYGVFAQVDGVGIPLEKKDVRVSQKQLASYLDRLGR